MRWALVVLVLLAGCSSPEQRRLIGQWEIADVESVSDRVGAEDVESKMMVQFQKSGKLITITKIGSINSTKEGTWKILEGKDDGNTLLVQSTLQSQTIDHEIDFIKDDVIDWIPPNMAGTTKKLRFKKSKSN